MLDKLFNVPNMFNKVKRDTETDDLWKELEEQLDNLTIDIREIREIIFELKKNKYLQISEFIMNNSENEEIGFIAFHPVYIETVNDTMDDIKKKALDRKSTRLNSSH